MAKLLTRLAMVLAAVWCVGEAALAQPRTGVGAAPAPHVSAPAPHISAPTPHISAPAVPHVSAPAPHIAPTPHINVAPRIATPHFSPGGATVHPFTPRGHGTWHALERGAGRSARRSASRAFAGRDLRHRRTGDLARSTDRERAFARDRSRTGGSGRLATNRTRITEPGHRPRAEAGGRHRLSGAQFEAVRRTWGERNRKAQA